jgi:hypothetical protein
MYARIDGKEPKQCQLDEVLNDVRVVLGNGRERHITVTQDRVIVNIVDGGEIVKAMSITHQELLADGEV